MKKILIMKVASEKTNKQKESRAAAHSVFQKKSNQKSPMGFAYNHPWPAAGRQTPTPSNPTGSSKFIRLYAPSRFRSRFGRGRGFVDNHPAALAQNSMQLMISHDFTQSNDETVGNEKRIVQRTITVGDEEYLEGIAPLRSWGLNPEQVTLYNYMLRGTSPDFTFPDRPKMLAFVRRYATLYGHNAGFFTDPENVPALEKITSAQPETTTETRAVLNGKITLTTENSNQIEVHPFASKNRHLLRAFKEDQARPRGAKISNSIVKWNFKFKNKFDDFVALQAQAISDNNILMGFEPSQVMHADSEISFESDQPELPNSSYDKTNAIHSFPASGTGLATLNQEQYDKINKILSHIYSTENYLLLRASTPLNPVIPIDPVITNNQRGFETTINGDIGNLRRLGLPVNQPPDLNQAATDLNIRWRNDRGIHYNRSLKSAIQNLHRLLVNYNVESEIDPGSDRLLVTVNEAVDAYDNLDTPGKDALKFLEPTINRKIAAFRLVITAQTNVPPNLNQQIQNAKRSKVNALINARNVPFTLGNFYRLYTAAKNVNDPSSTLI